MKPFSIYHLSFTILLIGCLACTSCNRNIVYSQFSSIPSDHWSIDSMAQFDYPITDTAIAYDMHICIRHTERYPYQNLWLFIENGASRDSMNVFLADDRGTWYGDSNNGFIEVAFPYQTNIHFADTGSYHLTIQHGMRDSLLRGVTEVGVEIIKGDR